MLNISATAVSSEPVYANLPVNNGTEHSPPTRSPPLPDSQPPAWGAAGTRQILKQSSRHSLQSQGTAPTSLSVSVCHCLSLSVSVCLCPYLSLYVSLSLSDSLLIHSILYTKQMQTKSVYHL